MRFGPALFRELLVVLPATCVLVLPAAGATINVDEVSPGVGAVVVANDTLCSIREAIINANDDAATHADCASGSGADTIGLPANAMFTLPDAAVNDATQGNTGLPHITSAITIQGNGSTIERSSGLTCDLNGTQAADEFRIVRVDSGSLTLEDTTLTNGCADGADLFAPGARGGGIYASGNLVLLRSTLTANQANLGGGLLQGGGTLTIEQSTLALNSARWGGAVFIGAGTVTMRSSTLTGNSAERGGGLYAQLGTRTLEQMTFVNNTATDAGGGIYGEGVPRIGSAVIRTKNLILSGSSCAGVFTAWNAQGANFDSGTSCADRFNASSPGTFTGNATLNLGPLADNGGPTETHALNTGSAALDAATDCTTYNGGSSITADQRGVMRPQGTECDAGAYELLATLSAPATILVDETFPGSGVGVVDWNPYDGLCSLREAIDNANATSTTTLHPDCEAGFTSGADTIVLPANATFTLTDAAVLNDVSSGNSGLPHITSMMTIQANGSTITRDSSLPCTLNGTQVAGEFRLLRIASLSVTLEDATLTNGCADGSLGRSGGAIMDDPGGDLVLRRSTVTGNQASAAGGGLFTEGGTLTIEHSTLASNSSNFGGAAYITSTAATVRNSTLSGNQATSSGGGFRIFESTVTLEHVTFVSNTAPSGGGVNALSVSFPTSIRAKNILLSGSSCGVSSSGTVVRWSAEGANFDSGTTCAGLFNASPPGTFTGNATLNLGPLADNGGPTMTHALGGGSDAIDAVPDGQCTPFGGGAGVAFTTDQRGETRALDVSGNAPALCDAGAFEVAPLSIGDVTQAEGTGGSSAFTFTVSRGTASVGDATVQVDTADGTATAPGDYTAIVAQTATIPDGASSTTVDVTVAGDTVYELDETFTVNLSNATNGVLTDATGIGTITNDDAPPSFSIDDVTLDEGNAGTTAFTFTITWGGGTAVDATVDVATADGSATVAGGDYTAVPLTTLTFLPGDTTKTVTVDVHGDQMMENDETFTVDLSSPTHATITKAQGLGTILNDDTAGVTIDPTAGLETTEAGGTDTFTVVLTSQPKSDVVIDVATSDSTEGRISSDGATQTDALTLTFTSGDWNVPQTVTVTGVDDDVADGDQPYTIVTAAAVSADGNFSGRSVSNVSVTNTDDDGAAIVVTPTSGLATTEAGGSDTFTIMLSSQPTANVTIGLSSSDTSEGAVSPSSVTFTAVNWNITQTVMVTGVDDVLADGDQPYTIVTDPAVSADPVYDGTLVADLSVTNLDDETSVDDSDGDGVPNTVEDGGPNGGDGNGDGIPDSLQPHVATFRAANGNGYITLMSTCELREVVALLKDGFEPAPVLLPYALVEFRLPCANADMTVLYHAGNGWSAGTGYWKYGPETPGQALTTTWYKLPGLVFDTTKVAGNTVARARFTLNDGQLGDDTGVDGEIVDQGGPDAPSVARIPTASEWMLLMMAMALALAGAWKLSR